MCVWSDWPYLAVTPIKFPLKAAPVYCIFSSSCRVLEVCTFHSSSGCSTAFFPLYYSIDVSLSHFQSIVEFLVYCCFFHLTLSFSKAIGPFLTLLGPRNLPSLSHQMYHWLSDMWKTAFWCKNCLDDFYMSNPNPYFCAGSNHYFSRYVFPSLILIISLLRPFFLQLHLLLIFRHLSSLYHLIFRYI